MSSTNTTYLLGFDLSLSCKGGRECEREVSGREREREREREGEWLTLYSLKCVLLKARKCGLLLPPLVSKQ